MFNKAVITISLLVLAIGTLVILILPTCSRRSDYNLDAQHFTATYLKLVETRTGMTFPDGSLGLNLFYRGSQIDPSFAARIQVPSEAEAAMIRQITSFTNVEINVSGSLFASVSWWKPSEGTIMAERKYYGPDGYYVHVILSLEGRNCVLYIEWASM